jgi:phosphoribosylaminoimidazole (AIR) synthetase
MRAGQVSLDEMRDVFNLGMGLVVATAPTDVESVRGTATERGIPTWIAGEIRAGPRGVRFT